MRFAPVSPSDVNHAAFLLGLIDGVGKEKALAARYRGFDRDQAPIFVRIDGEGLFMERLFFDVGAVDQQRDSMQMAEFFAAILSVGHASGFGGRSVVGAASFGLSKFFPDSAQSRLPSDG